MPDRIFRLRIKLRRWPKLTIQLCVLVLCAAVAHATELDDGYRNLYNRNYEGGRADFRTWMTAYPEDPFGPASDAAALLFMEFDRLNIVEIQLFNEPNPTVDRQLPPRNPNLRADFDQRMQQAEKLADAILAKSPKDAHALFTKMFIYGLRADYAEMLDKSDFKALQFSKKGAAYSEQALQADPQLYDAHIATGFENYMLSLKPMPVRFVVRLMGGQTDKAKGISELRITAEHGRYLANFAKLLLAVAVLREGNKDEARQLLGELARDFPQNPLYAHQLSRIQ
jgi:hypothetical protein